MWNSFAQMLPVNTLLKNYNPSVDDIYPMCKNSTKFVIHLFIQSLMDAHIWFGLSFQHMIYMDFNWIEEFFISWFVNS